MSLGWLDEDGFGAKENLLPVSCRIENCSSGGKREEISSTSGFGGEAGLESRAAKGSLDVTLMGEGFGRGACPLESFVGLPRLIGVMSGMTVFSTTGGAA